MKAPPTRQFLMLVALALAACGPPGPALDCIPIDEQLGVPIGRQWCAVWGDSCHGPAWAPPAQWLGYRTLDHARGECEQYLPCAKYCSLSSCSGRRAGDTQQGRVSRSPRGSS